MATIKLPFVGGAYETHSKDVAAQEAINCYVEADGQASPSLVGVPGLRTFLDLGVPIRGMMPIDYQSTAQNLAVVAGSSYYEVNVLGFVTQYGAVLGGSAASMIQNPTQIMIFGGNTLYYLDKSARVVTVIADQAANSIVAGERLAYIDGYGITWDRLSDVFWYTDVLDFSSIGGLNFASAEGFSDTLISVANNVRELWLMGRNTIEVWLNVGDATNPFQRLPGGFIERGCLAPRSVATRDGSVFWLGDDRVVYRSQGLQPVRISNFGIENLINQENLPEDCIATTYSAYGHSFYQLSFFGVTIVYDLTNGLWHTRRSIGSDRSVIEHSASIWNKTLVGGTDGVIYELDRDLYTEGSIVSPTDTREEIERIRTVGPLRIEGYATLASVTFVMETGGNDDLATDKKVFLEVSRDGGRTYGNRMERSVGKSGEYVEKIQFNGLGGFYDNQCVLKLTMTDNAKFALVDAYADVV